MDDIVVFMLYIMVPGSVVAFPSVFGVVTDRVVAVVVVVVVVVLSSCGEMDCCSCCFLVDG